jgi:hypothetical protein
MNKMDQQADGLHLSRPTKKELKLLEELKLREKEKGKKKKK